MGVRQDFSFFVGEDFTYIDNVPASNMMTPTLWTVAMKIWNQAGVLVQTIAGTVTDPNNASYPIPATINVPLGAGEFWYEASRIDGGAYKVLSYGNMVLKPKPPIQTP